MKKYKVILISGGFDPVHKGHIECIQNAKKLADEVWIGLNNDSWLYRKKGKQFMKEDERVAIVSSIGIVDKSLVSIDKDKTQCETLAFLAKQNNKKYDLFFANGGDQNNNSIPEAGVCNKLHIGLIDGLGDKIQSSSWLLKK